ncbi:MAG: hypothetical protein ABEI77_09425, partial [Halorientalis sp.]
GQLGDSIPLITSLVKYRLCVYVSVAKPSRTIDRAFESSGAKTQNIFYIDCATALTGLSVKRANNVVYLKPSALTDISISLKSAVGEVPADREGILVFDTLSTLMIYNDTDVVSKFAHALMSNVRQWPIKAVVFTIDEEMDDVVKSRLTQFSDQTITVSDSL